MDEYDYDDYSPDECLHGVYYKEYCEKCCKADAQYEKAQDQADWNYWHPSEE